MSATYAGMSSYEGFYPTPAYDSGFYTYQSFYESFVQPHNAYYAPVSFSTYPQQAGYPWQYVAMPPFAGNEVVTTPYQPPASCHPPSTSFQQPPPASFQTPPQASFRPHPPASFQPRPHAWRTPEPRTKIPVGTPCAVCDDTASGYYYGAASCAGCRNFFRRTIATGDAARIQCQHVGTCAVTKKTKYACRQCRFTKCLLAGMALGGKAGRPSTHTPSRGRSNVLERTPCAICSDTAAGYHYDVALCQGCLETVIPDRKDPVPSGKRRLHAPTTVFNERFRYGNAVLTKFT